MPKSSDNPSPAADLIQPRDAILLLDLMGMLGVSRQDPRVWRQELLGGINRIFNAAVSAAFLVRQTGDVPVVASVVDAGFKSEEQHQAFLREFNTAPFRDPQSRLALERFTSRQLDTYTCLRAELVEDAAWEADVHVLTHRRGTGLGDCVMSLQRAGERGSVYGLCVYRMAPSPATPGSPDPGTQAVGTAPFRVRERVLLDTLHRGIENFYRAEESSQRSQPAAALPPRLRQTLDLLLTGDTERQVALKMSLSIHTVHDYVKALYTHFGVSSRGELLSKWISSSGKIPPKE